MDATRSDFMQRLLFWSTVIVLWHSVAVVWHLYLVLRLQINFPRLAIPSLMSVLPVSGIVGACEEASQITDTGLGCDMKCLRKFSFYPRANIVAGIRRKE